MGLTNCEICGGELYGSAEVRRCNNCRRYCHHCSAKDAELAKLREEKQKLRDMLTVTMSHAQRYFCMLNQPRTEDLYIERENCRPHFEALQDELAQLLEDAE